MVIPMEVQTGDTAKPQQGIKRIRSNWEKLDKTIAAAKNESEIWEKVADLRATKDL